MFGSQGGVPNDDESHLFHACPPENHTQLIGEFHFSICTRLVRCAPDGENISLGIVSAGDELKPTVTPIAQRSSGMKRHAGSLDTGVA